MAYSITQIKEVIHAKTTLLKDDERIIDHLLIDSRRLLFPQATLFFALHGPRRDGTAFINELYAKGVRNFVIDIEPGEALLTSCIEANFLEVKNVLQALQQLAAHHRSLYNIPVIGITGSNGKTIVKEWLFQLLQQDYNIVRSPKSYNSQVGVPLSVWQMNSQHTLAIFEAGISQPDEMQQLEKILQPTIGIFTNIGEAHSEGFLNIRQKVNEKLKLFLHSNLLIYNVDNPDVNLGVHSFVSNVRSDKKIELLSWSRKDGAALHITNIEIAAGKTTITAADKRNEEVTQNISITIPFTDEASIQNAIHCWCVLLQLNITADTISERMLQLKAVEMRLELKQGINNCSVINDSYNADLNSLTLALDFLMQQQQHPTRTLILSDILESGKKGSELYEEVASILEQKKINRFIGIGPDIFRHQAIFNKLPQAIFFTSTSEFKNQFYTLHFFNETILLKGARVFEFEQISHLLEQKAHQTVLEINLNAVTHNLKAYQQIIAPGVKVMVMVKAFGYGSGGFEVANLLQFHKVDYLAVAYADEGVELRKAGITLPVLVLNTEEATYDMMVQYNLEPEIYSFVMMSSFQQYLDRYGISNYPIHIKIDTGMHRLGFELKDMELLCSKLTATQAFKVQSVFSHLVGSESAAMDDFTEYQADTFLKACKALQQCISYPFIRHIGNTSSISRHPQLQLDMVRLGIGLYGVDGNEEMQQKLRNVSTLKTTISQVKKVKQGDTIGYNRKGITTRDSVIATVRIGYADGYHRILSNGVGKMLVKGKLAPVIGNISMDMTMIDITGIDAEAGDEVIVFGEALPVNELATWANTIAYEMLTSISQRVKRVYYEE